MCWSFNFGFPSNKKRNESSPNEKKKREIPRHGIFRQDVTEPCEKRSSEKSSLKRVSGNPPTPRSPRREHGEHRPRSHHSHDGTRRIRDEFQTGKTTELPKMHSYTVEQPASASSSQEALLNPRPHRSQHARKRHPKRTSQTTLRGRGAKRDPLELPTSKGNHPGSSRGWLLVAPYPPKTTRRERSHRDSQVLDSSPRNRSSRHRGYTTIAPQTYPEPSQSQTNSYHSRQHEQQASSSRSTRLRTPNTAARRIPDRRFAVLAATNQALENVRREAFAQPSPPPRRERLRRYEGVSVPTSQIPFNWDCLSSSQASTSQIIQEPGVSRRRRSRRYDQ